MRVEGKINISFFVYFLRSSDNKLYKPGEDLGEISFELPKGKRQGRYLAFVTSEVDIGSQHLSPYQSLITVP